MVEKHGRNFTVVVLGAQTQQERLDLAKKIVYNQLRDIDIDREIEQSPWHQRFFTD
jgi:hypothetical protein